MNEAWKITLGMLGALLLGAFLVEALLMLADSKDWPRHESPPLCTSSSPLAVPPFTPQGIVACRAACESATVSMESYTYEPWGGK